MYLRQTLPYRFVLAYVYVHTIASGVIFASMKCKTLFTILILLTSSFLFADSIEAQDTIAQTSEGVTNDGFSGGMKDLLAVLLGLFGIGVWMAIRSRKGNKQK